MAAAGGVFSYHDTSTYSSTIEDESRMMKSQIVSTIPQPPNEMESLLTEIIFNKLFSAFVNKMYIEVPDVFTGSLQSFAALALGL